MQNEPTALSARANVRLQQRLYVAHAMQTLANPRAASANARRRRVRTIGCAKRSHQAKFAHNCPRNHFLQNVQNEPTAVTPSPPPSETADGPAPACARPAAATT